MNDVHCTKRTCVGVSDVLINPYPGNLPPVHFFLCISKTLKDTVMRFGDIVQDSQGWAAAVCNVRAPYSGD